MVWLERSLFNGNWWEPRAPNIKAAGLLLTTQNQSWFQEQRVIFPLDTCNLLSNHLSRPPALLVTFVPSWRYSIPYSVKESRQHCLSFDLRYFQGRDNQLYVLPLPNVDIKPGYLFWSWNVLIFCFFWLLMSSPGLFYFHCCHFLPFCLHHLPVIKLCHVNNCLVPGQTHRGGSLGERKGLVTCWRKRRGAKTTLQCNARRLGAQEQGEREREKRKCHPVMYARINACLTWLICELWHLS